MRDSGYIDVKNALGLYFKVNNLVYDKAKVVEKKSGRVRVIQ